MRWFAGFAGVLVAASVAGAQQGPRSAVAGIKPGQVRVITTIQNANGTLKVDTVLVTVVPPAIATITLLNAFNPPSWQGMLTQGKSFCAFAVARDSAGNVLTGRPVAWASSDTSVVKIVAGGACADTTIDPAKLTVNPMPPMTSLERR